MSYKIEIFDWVAPHYHQDIPEYMSLEEMEDFAEALRSEIEDMNLQIKQKRIRAKLENELEDRSYLDWLERITTRLRFKTAINGVILYNLRKIKRQEEAEKRDRVRRLENQVNGLAGIVGTYRQQDKDYDILERKVANLEKEFVEHRNKVKSDFQTMHKLAGRIEAFKRWTMRILYYLITKQAPVDSEWHRIYGRLKFVSEVVEQNPEWGTKENGE